MALRLTVSTSMRGATDHARFVMCRLAVVGALAVLQVVGESVLRPASAQKASRQQEQLLDSLRREVSDGLLASGKFSAVQLVDAKTLKARKLSGGEIVVNLDNALAGINAKPSDRANIVRRLLATALAAVRAADVPTAPQTKQQFIESLRLLVRHSDYLKAVVGADGKAGKLPIAKPFAGDAHVIVAFGGSESLTLATSGSGTAYGLDDQAVYDLALAQTQKLNAEVTVDQFGAMRAYAAREGAFSPSLLMIDQVVTGLEQGLGPGFLVSIPDRTILVVAPRTHAADLMTVAQAFAQQRKAPLHIPHLMQRQGNAWARYPSR